MAPTTILGPYDPNCGVVVVCGGGPAGLLAACLLSKLGLKVHVFEKREDPGKSRPGRSWRIVLHERAQKVLRLADLDVTTADVCLKLKGAMLHSVRGKREIPYNPDLPPYTVDRTDLMQALLVCVRQCSAAMNYNACFSEFGQSGDTLEFMGGPGTHQGPWALLLAADGEHSSVRQTLHRNFGFQVSQTLSNKEYIQISGSSTILKKMGLDRRYVNVFNKNGDAQLIFTTGTGDVDGGVMILNKEGEVSFEALRAKNSTELKKFLQDYFTKEGEEMLQAVYAGNFAGYLKEADVFPGNAATYCNELHGLDGRVLVIGDAAHSMSASLGQGCNTALEDVSVLHAMLKQGIALGDVGTVFTARRHEDISAIMDMSAHAFPETKLGFAAWVLQSMLAQGLYTRIPSIFPQPMRLLISKDVPFKVVLQRKIFEGRLFKACCLFVLMYPCLFLNAKKLPLLWGGCIAVLPCAALLYAASALWGAWPDGQSLRREVPKVSSRRRSACAPLILVGVIALALGHSTSSTLVQPSNSRRTSQPVASLAVVGAATPQPPKVCRQATAKDAVASRDASRSGSGLNPRSCHADLIQKHSNVFSNMSQRTEK